MNKSGQHKFSYTGQGSDLRPLGICTDVLGHILVCDNVSKGVQLLDQQGSLLSVIRSPQQRGIQNPYCVCVDDKNNLYVGYVGYDGYAETLPFPIAVTVYKYLV